MTRVANLPGETEKRQLREGAFGGQPQVDIVLNLTCPAQESLTRDITAPEVPLSDPDEELREYLLEHSRYLHGLGVARTARRYWEFLVEESNIQIPQLQDLRAIWQDITPHEVTALWLGAALLHDIAWQSSKYAEPRTTRGRVIGRVAKVSSLDKIVVGAGFFGGFGLLLLGVGFGIGFFSWMGVACLATGLVHIVTK